MCFDNYEECATRIYDLPNQSNIKNTLGKKKVKKCFIIFKVGHWEKYWVNVPKTHAAAVHENAELNTCMVWNLQMEINVWCRPKDIEERCKDHGRKSADKGSQKTR